MKKVLFIGNSHTYMNDMPELARRMIEDATGEACEVFALSYSARPLKWHMKEEYFSVRFNILHGGYDYCVIQEQAHPMPHEKDTIKYAGRIIELCKKAGTTPIVFETWAEKAKPENQAEMNRRYRALAEGKEALLAPIGEVWERVLQKLTEIPDADLYYRDGAHASAVGDYLVAMVLTKAITGRLPKEDYVTAFDFSLPDDEWTHVKEDVEEETIRLPREVVQVIRDCVNEVSDSCVGEKSNPWEEISLSDYENHMSLDSVRQLQAMNALMKKQFEAYPVETAMVLGVAGGNGLEHVDAGRYKTVYGVDINEEYLKAVSERYSKLANVLELLKIDLLKEADKLPKSELLIANLLIEYIGYDSFAKAVAAVNPRYVSCVIQINEDEHEWVSDSPYIHSFDRLDEVHHQMRENELAATMKKSGYSEILREKELLPNGKALVRIDFEKNGGSR